MDNLSKILLGLLFALAILVAVANSIWQKIVRHYKKSNNKILVGTYYVDPQTGFLITVLTVKDGIVYFVIDDPAKLDEEKTDPTKEFLQCFKLNHSKFDNKNR